MFQTRWKVHHKENLVLERGMWAGQIPQDLRKHRGEVPGFSIFQIGCWRSLQARISNQSRPKQTKTKSKKNLFFLAKVPGKERNPVQQERNLFDSNWGPALDFGPPFCSCSQLGKMLSYAFFFLKEHKPCAWECRSTRQPGKPSLPPLHPSWRASGSHSGSHSGLGGSWGEGKAGVGMVLCSAGKKSTPLWPTRQHQVARVSTISPSRPGISQPPPLNLVTWQGQGGTGSPEPHQVAGGGESLSSPTTGVGWEHTGEFGSLSLLSHKAQREDPESPSPCLLCQWRPSERSRLLPLSASGNYCPHSLNKKVKRGSQRGGSWGGIL